MKKKYKKQYEQSQQAVRTPLYQPGHKILTRRDMLAQGLIRMGSYVAAPSILTMMANTARGQECSAGDSGAANGVPYLHVELSGGASIAGNILFGKQRDGAPFEALAAGSYATLGLDASVEPGALAPNMDFGAPIHANSSLLAGLLSIMSPEAVAKTAVVGGAGASADDSRNNPLNGIQLAVNVAQSPGQLVSIAGSDASNTGGRTRELDVGTDPSLSRARIQQASEVLGLVDPGLIAQRLSPDDAVRIAQAAKMMSDSQLAMFAKQDLPTQVKTLVQCGYIGSEDLLKFDATQLTPNNDPAISGITNINLADQDDEQTATIAKLLTDGNAAGATIELGGYDYHGRGRNAQNDRDFAAGRRIGLALEVAHQKGSALFIAVTSDGSVSARNGNPNAQGQIAFTSDSGSRGSYAMFVIGREPGVKPPVMNAQIGAFSDAGAVDTTYLVTADSPRLQALNIVYNYAAFSGSMDKFNEQMAAAGESNPFAGNERQYQAFGSII